jgi:hypothetical protein
MAIKRKEARSGVFQRAILGSGSVYVCGAENAEPTAIQHVGVDHRCIDMTMAEQFLDGSDVIASLKQVSRK